MSQKYFTMFVISFILWLVYFFFAFSEKTLPLSGTEGKFPVEFKEFPLIDGDRLQAIVRHESGEKMQLVYYLATEEEKRRFEQLLTPGTICRASGVIEVPQGPTNPNAFNYRLYLRTKGVDYVLRVDQLGSCVHGKRSVFDDLLVLRKKGMDQVDAYFPNDVAPFIKALLFGDTSEIAPDVMSAYQNLGISHLLAISGTHITILTVFLYVLFVRSGFTKETTNTVLLIFLPVYSVLAGSSPSVNRAVFMAWMIMFLTRRRFSLHPLDALGLTFILFIALNPYSLFHVGFQLSYLITAGLILSRKIFETFSSPFLKMAMVSWIAQLLSIPVLLYHFYEFSLLGFVVNLLYVPLYSLFILPLAFLTFLLLVIVPVISMPFVAFLTILIEVANILAEWLHAFPRFTIILGKPDDIVFLIYWVCFLAGSILFEKNWKAFKKIIVVLILTPFFLHLLLGKYSPQGEVTVLDVGQGDSIFIRLPFNKGNYLIDTGGVMDFNEEAWRKRRKPFDPGEDIVVPFLKSKGVDRLDKLIITHGDWDHLGSAVKIVSLLPVDEVVFGKTSGRKETELELMQFLQEKGIQVTEVHRGLYWKEGEYSFYILAPEKNSRSGNNASLVIFTELGGYRWLFTGDLETDGEVELLSSYPNLSIDVLKVGHHGSRTSSSSGFLDQITPEVAIISVGRNNRFGHPHKEVLERLEERNIAIFRTDIHGAITFSFLHDLGIFSYYAKTDDHPSH